MPAAPASIVPASRVGRALRAGSRRRVRVRRSLLVAAAVAALTGGAYPIPGPAAETPGADVRVAPFRWEATHRTTA